MKPTDLEYRQLKEMDERLIKFKESEWDRLGHPYPNIMLLLVCIFSIPFIGQVLLLIGLLFERFYKLWRMLSILAKAFYFYSWVALDRFETKLFEIMEKNDLKMDYLKSKRFKKLAKQYRDEDRRLHKARWGEKLKKIKE